MELDEADDVVAFSLILRPDRMAMVRNTDDDGDGVDDSKEEDATHNKEPLSSFESANQ